MTGSKNFAWVLGICVALLLGVALGVWIGVKTEQDALIAVFTEADLTADCRSQVADAMGQVVKGYELPDLGP